MKRLAVVGLACLLTACQWSLADLLPDKPEKVADFPATTAADLSHCVHQTARPAYAFHLNARADHLEFLITTIRESDTTMRPNLSELELHFMTNGESTTVEMQERAIKDHVLSRDIWSLVEHCAQQVAKHPAEKSTAP